MKPPLVDPGALADELHALHRLSRHTLAEKWGALCGTPPPPRTSRLLMMRAVAHKLQERAYGGFPLATRRILVQQRETAPIKPRLRELRPGTVLLREWQGTTHQVTIIEDGVVYRGKRYRSLSEIARVITGSRWSGPRFFGLQPNAKA
jgi:hypothetical protein